MEGYVLAKEQLRGKIVTFVVGTVISAVLLKVSGWNNDIIGLLLASAMCSAMFYLPFQYGSYLGLGLSGRIVAGLILVTGIGILSESIPGILAVLLIFGIPGGDIFFTARRMKKYAA